MTRKGRIIGGTAVIAATLLYLGLRAPQPPVPGAATSEALRDGGAASGESADQVAAETSTADASVRINRFGYCPSPGERYLDVKRPSLVRYIEEHEGTPEAALLEQAAAAGRRRDPQAVVAALTEVMRIAPDPAVALPLASLLVHTPELGSALVLLDSYLAAHPDDPPVSQMRARVALQADLQRGFQERTLDGVHLAWPPSTLSDAAATSLLSSIRDSLDRAGRLTLTLRRKQLTVVVYREQSDLLAVTCAQAWTGAAYDGTLRLVWAPTAALGVESRVLAHEALHAQLGELLPGEPVWFHEGLAQYFAAEQGRAYQAVYAFMLRNRTYIPFSSLAGSFMVFVDNSAAGMAYPQSLAMVKMLVADRGEEAIADAVRYLREEGPEEFVGYLASRSAFNGDALLSFLAPPSDEFHPAAHRVSKNTETASARYISGLHALSILTLPAEELEAAVKEAAKARDPARLDPIVRVIREGRAGLADLHAPVECTAVNDAVQTRLNDLQELVIVLQKMLAHEDPTAPRQLQSALDQGSRHSREFDELLASPGNRCQ